MPSRSDLQPNTSAINTCENVINLSQFPIIFLEPFLTTLHYVILVSWQAISNGTFWGEKFIRKVAIFVKKTREIESGFEICGANLLSHVYRIAVYLPVANKSRISCWGSNRQEGKLAIISNSNQSRITRQALWWCMLPPLEFQRSHTRYTLLGSFRIPLVKVENSLR